MGKQQTTHSATPSVVPLSNVPISSAPEDASLEVRRFVAHEVLGSAVPDSVEIAWTYARHGQDVAVRSHADPGLLIVLQGSANLVGGTQRHVEQGDVITVPKHQGYGFTSVGCHGLHALHMAFQTDANSSPAHGFTLDTLVQRNEVRARASLEGPLYQLVRDATLNTECRRSMLRKVMRVFSDTFQVMLFARQALCRDERYQAVFGEHLSEEFGHNTLLEAAGNGLEDADPILKATCSWFCHQMLVMDNAAKAVVHLVLETGAHHFFDALHACPFNDDVAPGFTGPHMENDARHRDMAIGLLRGQHSSTYRRLHEVLEDSWDMLEAACLRMAVLVRGA